MVTNHPGARLFLCCQGRLPTKQTAEAKSTPGFPGRGFLCAIVADPPTVARAGRIPSLRILPTPPRHDSSARLRPTRRPAASPSCGRACRFRPRVPGPDRRRGTGGATVNCSTTRCTTPAATPRTGSGGVRSRGTQDPRPSPPVRRHAARLRQDPRLSRTESRSCRPLLLEYARAGLLLAVRNSSTARVHRRAANRPRCPRRLENGRLRPGRQPRASNPTGRVIWLTWRTGVGNGPGRPPQPVGRTGKTAAERRAGATPVGRRIQNRDRRKMSRRIPTPGNDHDRSPPTLYRPVLRRPTPLRAPAVVLDCQPDSRCRSKFPTGLPSPGPRSPGN